MNHNERARAERWLEKATDLAEAADGGCAVTGRGHTPGPWRIGGASPVSGEPKIVGPDGRTICRMADRSLASRPDALLIASAPDLLAACEEAREGLFCDSVPYTGAPRLGCGCYPCEVGRVLNRAIRKARGERPCPA